MALQMRLRSISVQIQLNDKEKRKIIIDCDPGADDALGLLLLLAAPELEILGITTICGNGPVNLMAENATKILALAARNDIKVYKGAEQPLVRSLEFQSLYCGKDGLCETGLIAHTELISEEFADDFLIKQLKNTDEKITIVCLAGLTNIASVLQQVPELGRNIEKIITSSGYFGFNPKEKRAEWNILVDPEAAEIVYDSGIEIQAIGLDVTSMLKDNYVEQLLNMNIGVEVASFIKKVIYYDNANQLYVRSILVDGMAAASAIDSSVTDYMRGKVTIDPKRSDAALMEFEPDEKGHVVAACKYNFDRYLEIMERGLKKYDSFHVN